MTTVTHVHHYHPAAAADLIASVPQPDRWDKRKQFKRELPEMLETALGLLLDEIDVQPGQTTSGAVGCRILAACIARLKD